MVSSLYILTKSAFPEFFETLKTLGTVYAPVRVSPQSFSFKAVESLEEIAFEAIRTILPPKKFFYPQRETLITYDAAGIHEQEPKAGFQVLFGVHPCDLAGLGIMDTIFLDAPADNHYAARRGQSLVVGLSCMPDKHCFCKSMGTDRAEKGYDLFLTDLGDDFHVDAMTEAGSAVAARAGSLLRPDSDEDRARYDRFWVQRDQAFTSHFEPDNLRAVVKEGWNEQIWEDLGKRCLSCGNCVPVCPTCYCFDLVDAVSLDGESGERQREWDACQFSGFAKVAGDFNFRPGPVDRLKFWYRHKLHGFDDAYGLPTCVGCGRCTVSCPAGIDDIVSVVKVLHAHHDEVHKQEELGVNKDASKQTSERQARRVDQEVSGDE